VPQVLVRGVGVRVGVGCWWQSFTKFAWLLLSVRYPLLPFADRRCNRSTHSVLWHTIHVGWDMHICPTSHVYCLVC
jgi:hypothetical protein